MDLNINESTQVTLCDGTPVTVKLLDLQETRDDVSQAVRRALRSCGGVVGRVFQGSWRAQQRRRAGLAARGQSVQRQRKPNRPLRPVHAVPPLIRAAQSAEEAWSVRSTCSGVIETRPCATAWKSVPSPHSRASPAGPIQ